MIFKQPWIARLMGLMLLGGLLAANSAAGNDLGRVRVPLPNGVDSAAHPDQARQAALRQGLEQVIGRLTGQSPASDQPGAAAALENPDRWLLRYGYEDGPPRQLMAVFDADALGDYLAGQGASVWRGPRPPVLVWLVDQGSARGEMVSAGERTAALLEQAAVERGLVLTLPKWDEAEQRSVTVADVRGRFDGPVLDASRRYGVAWVATAVIYGGGTTINWRLLHGGEAVAQGREPVDSKAHALDRLAAGIAQAMTQRYQAGGASGGGDRTNLVIRGVDTLAGWHHLQQQLDQLGAVRAVALRVAHGDELRFAVDFSGPRDQLAGLLDGIPGLNRCGGDPAATALIYCRR